MNRIMGPVPPAILPVPSRKAPPPDAKDLEQGFVVVRFDVDPLGRVSDATVIESDPANLLEERVQETARRTLFRPRFVDGAPVATTGLVLRHEPLRAETVKKDCRRRTAATSPATAHVRLRGLRLKPASAQQARRPLAALAAHRRPPRSPAVPGWKPNRSPNSLP
jgi:TonB family protein